jgi:hypothetical protein
MAMVAITFCDGWIETGTVVVEKGKKTVAVEKKKKKKKKGVQIKSGRTAC